jgi:hypothetical protein
MEGRGWARWPSLFGVVFVIVGALRLWVISGDLPAVDAPGREVIAYYDENAGRESAASVMALVAALLLVLFAAHVRRIVLAAEGPPGYLAAVFFAGAIILATAIAVGEALHGVLTFDPTELTPAAAEAINALDRQFFFPTAFGFCVFLLGAGLAIVRLRLLPAWLGWVGIVLALVTLTPAGYFAFIAALAWIFAVSVLLYFRPPEDLSRANPRLGS